MSYSFALFPSLKGSNVTLNEAFSMLRSLPTPVVKTNDAAAIWSVTGAAASQMLGRLAEYGNIIRLTRGIWLLEKNVHPWTLHPYLSDPSPSYLSLQTALFHHEMIEQIPTVIHVITVAKSRNIKTSVGTFAMHQVAPAFFSGFVAFAGGPALIAVPEKTLVDFFYFRQSRSRAFRALPELELPKSFKMKQARAYAALIESKSRRALVERLLREI